MPKIKATVGFMKDHPVSGLPVKCYTCRTDEGYYILYPDGRKWAIEGYPEVYALKRDAKAAIESGELDGDQEEIGDEKAADSHEGANEWDSMVHPATFAILWKPENLSPVHQQLFDQMLDCYAYDKERATREMASAVQNKPESAK